MGYGDNYIKKQGIREELNIVPDLISSMEAKWDCEVKINHSSLNENMREKIDYHIDIFSPVRHVKMKADYKSGDSFTLVSDKGYDNLAPSKSDFIIQGKPQSFVFIKVSKLKEVIGECHPHLRSSKFDNSQYFFLGQYLAMNGHRFSEKELFSIPRI